MKTITKIEGQILYKKYIGEGLNQDQANEKVTLMKKHLKDLVTKLRKKNKTPEEINSRFKKEFFKLVERSQ